MDDQLDRLANIVDVHTPSAARVYDYVLGGSHNFEVDRMTGDAVIRALPRAKEAAIANRAFLRRAVRFCVAQGIRQFVDIGSGTPTTGNVHEVAQEADPECRVVYVDNDSDAPAEIIATFRRVMAPGSYLALSHATSDAHPEVLRRVIEIYRNSTNPVTTRSAEQVHRLFAGFDLIEPGLTWSELWRPEHPALISEDPTSSAMYAAVGHKS